MDMAPRNVSEWKLGVPGNFDLIGSSSPGLPWRFRSAVTCWSRLWSEKWRSITRRRKKKKPNWLLRRSNKKEHNLRLQPPQPLLQLQQLQPLLRLQHSRYNLHPLPDLNAIQSMR